MKKIFAGLSFLLLLSACNPQTTEEEKTNVVTSFYPIEFLTSQIAKNQITLTNLIPAGAEPHDYELTPHDLSLVAQSDLLIVNGLVEPWYANVEKNVEGSSLKILNLSEKISLLGSDPHFWLDPTRMSLMADNVRDALVAEDPDHATVYEANTLTLKQELEALDGEYKTGLSKCVSDNFVTSHAAFAYLASRYGLNQTAIAGLSPEEEPSVEKLKEVVDFVENNQVKVIFFESLVPPDLANTIADETGASTMVLNPIEGLTQEERAAGEDYFSIMRENLANLKIALSCQ